MKDFAIKKSIGLRITVLFLIIVLTLTTLLTVILYNQTASLVLKETTDRAYQTVEQASKLINIDEFKKIKSVEDEA